MSEKNTTKSCGLRATPQNLIYNNYNMKRQDLSNLNKDQLINLLLKQNTKIDLLKNKLDRPTPTSRKNVKQLVQDYEDNIIPPPIEFQDRPVPKPRTIKRPIPFP